MNRHYAALFVFSLLLGVVLAQSTWPFVITGTALPQNVNKVYTSSNQLNIPNNLDHHGKLTVKVTADTTVIVCINEEVQLASGINSCSPNGRLNFTWTNTTNKINNPYISSFFQTNEIDAYLRFNKVYYVSYQLEWNNPAVNVTDIRIEIQATTCPDPTQDGPNCGKQVPATLVPATPQTATLQPGETIYYLYNPTNQLLFHHVAVTQTGAGNANLYVLSKRAGLPLYKDQSFVPSSYDWMGNAIAPNETDIHINFPRPDKYFYYVFNNDTTTAVTFTITLNVGGAADINKLNATTPQFDSRKENNTLSFAAAQGPLNNSIIYFTFPGAQYPELKLGIAPEDDSDPTPDVYVDIGLIPSPDSNILANTNKTEPAHLLYATQTPKSSGFVWYQFEKSANADPTDWYVAINSTNAFVLWSAVNGTCANNCSEHGKCDDTSGICNCDDGYEKYDCSVKVFPLVWIILIAIGGAILLAIAIGVPVSCYLKNKKKSGYERV